MRTDPFDVLFTEFPKASEAAISPHGPRWLRAKDENGNIYKILNPGHWKIWADKNGRDWVARPKPELLATADEARRMATPRKSAAKSKPVSDELNF